MGRGGFPLHVGGVAKVYCIHDREKRELTNVDEAIKLGREYGYSYDPKKHKFQNCPCCENVFVSEDDTPKLCSVCLGIPLHKLMGIISEPKGVINE